jgi:glycosyltransferase involved in cell wall biosynthesis
VESDYSNTEVIVIDGGSTDGSVDLLKKYDSKLAYWVSEADSGVSDAVNKGIARARGEIIRFLGDDDELILGCFAAMIAQMTQRPNIDVLIAHADFYVEDDSGSMARASIEQPVGPIGFDDFMRIGSSGVGWPSPEVSFFRRHVFQKWGGFDCRFHYLAYLDIFLRLAKNRVCFEAVPTLITKRYLTQKSDTIRGNKKVISRELERVLGLHGGIPWKVKQYGKECRRVAKAVMHPAKAARKILEKLDQH